QGHLAFTLGLALPPRTAKLVALRRRSSAEQSSARRQQPNSLVGAGWLIDSSRTGWLADGHLDGISELPGLGWPGAHFRRSPCNLEHQFGLPFVGAPPVPLPGREPGQLDLWHSGHG